MCLVRRECQASSYPGDAVKNPRSCGKSADLDSVVDALRRTLGVTSEITASSLTLGRDMQSWGVVGEDFQASYGPNTIRLLAFKRICELFRP